MKLKAPKVPPVLTRGTLLRTFRKRGTCIYNTWPSQAGSFANVPPEDVMSLGEVKTAAGSFRNAYVRVLTSCGAGWVRLADLRDPNTPKVPRKKKGDKVGT